MPAVGHLTEKIVVRRTEQPQSGVVLAQEEAMGNLTRKVALSPAPEEVWVALRRRPCARRAKVVGATSRLMQQ